MFRPFKNLPLSIFLLLPPALFASGEKPWKEKAEQWMSQQQVRFTENKGQLCDTDGKPVPWVLFNAKAPGLDLYVTEKGLSYVFFKLEEEEKENEKQFLLPGTDTEKKELEWCRIDVALQGANISTANMLKDGASTDVSNYFLGHCPEGIMGVHSYERVTFKDVYPGIDWVLYNSSDKGFKYDFIVHPNADPNKIRLIYSSLKPLKMSKNGQLEVHTDMGTLLEEAPVSYQGEREVRSCFFVGAEEKNTKGGYDRAVSFYLAKYDKTKTLVIDPQLMWGSFFGGNNLDGFKGIDCDAAGNSYVTGYFYSNNIPVQNPGGGAYFQGVFGGASSDAFILRFTPGGVLTWATYYGGNSNDQGNAIVCDAVGNIYVTGTASGTFPTQAWGGAYYDPSPGAGFILRFQPNGVRDWATFYDVASAYGIAIDGGGNIYITGTAGAGMPCLAWGTAYFSNVMNGVVDGFVIRFTNTGVRTWATYYGANNLDWPYTIDTDAAGNIYMAGYTQSSNLTTQAWGSYLDITLDGGNDAFIVRFNNTGGLSFASYFGGTGGDYISSLATDLNGNIYAIGETGSANMTTQAWGIAYFDNTMSGANDAFILRFSNTGTLDWSTFYGGSGQEAQSNTYDNICTDNCGNVYVIFNTPSNDIQTYNPGCGAYFDGTFGGGGDVFLLKFNGAGQRLWATYIGDVQPDQRHCIAVDNNYNLVIGGEWMGYATLGALPVLNPGGGAYFDNTPNGGDDSFIMRFIPTFTVTPTSTSAGCTCVGTATASATCGTNPYTYSWSNGQTTAIATGLCAGTYTITVSDSACLVRSATIAVAGSSSLALNNAQMNVQCFGQSNGSASVTVSNGTSPYTYSWNNSQTTATATGLSAGNYTVIITDSGGCTSSQTYSITQPSQVAVPTSSSNANCGQNNGSTSVTASGGTGAYTYNWSPGGQTTATATGLSGGIYTVTVTDNNGCTQTAAVVVGSSGSGTATATATATVSCNGGSNGSAQSSITGGISPYTYSWNNGQTSQGATGLSAGTFTVTITDASGCTVTQTVTITQPNQLAAAVGSSSASCNPGNDGTASVTASGGTGAFTYSWSNGSTQSSINNLPSTIYSVTITDANGCTTTKTVNVGQQSGPTATATAAPSTIIQGQSTTLTGGGGNSYTWSPSTGLSCTNCQNPTASPTITTLYCLVVSDQNGCTATACVTVFVEADCPSDQDLTVPNAFSPNGDGHNDIILLHGWKDCVTSFVFIIYNRWGEKVFESDDPTKGWDGIYNGKLQDPAVFAYYISATNNRNEAFIKKGNISLLR